MESADITFRTRKWVAVAGNTVTVLTLAYFALHPMPGIAAATLLLIVIGLAGGSYGLLVKPNGQGNCGGACAYNRYTLSVQLATP